MPNVTYEAQILRIGGEPALIQAGTLHYFRLPHPDLWRPVLERMRMAGLNAVMVPFPWLYHSPSAGFYDFTGPRDVRRLLDEVERMGLWLIVHPGPWVGADMDAGGVPAWCRRTNDFIPRCDSTVPAGPSFAFLRYVREWWERLFPYFLERPNLLMLVLDPGPCVDGPRAAGTLSRYIPPLVELVRDLGAQVPCAVPASSSVNAPDADVALLPWVRTAMLDLKTLDALPVPLYGAEVSIGTRLTWDSDTREQVLRVLSTEHPRDVMAELAARGLGTWVLSPAHVGSSWGYWRGAGRCTVYGVGGIVEEGGTLPEAYYQARRMALTLETLGEALATSQSANMVYASDARYLSAARDTVSGTTIAFLSSAQVGSGETRVSLALGGEMLTTEPVVLLDDTVRILPLNWELAGGRLLTSTLEPILYTTIAGRRLLVLANAMGGDLLLSDDFRPRHARGPVRTQRTSAGLAVRVEASRVVSLLLDGPEGPLQVLALAPRFAERVWPLDDGWRVTPAYGAVWNPTPDAPARGLLIGPELVSPCTDGGYRYLVGEKGFGYRWGPWRGSDPNTWLAPLTWRAPRKVDVPELLWDTPRPGAPEVLSAYDDADWRSIARRSPLSMTIHGIDYGFVWYRGRFSGPASGVTLRSRHACDVFLNGVHIAALNTPPTVPGASPGGAHIAPKTLPLPAHLLQEDNVLAILVEAAGQEGSWDTAGEMRGVLSCTLDSGEPIRWCLRPGLTGERSVQGFPGYADWTLIPDDGAADITWHRAAFELDLSDDVECPLFVYIAQVPTRAYIYLNGQLIGHYWDGHSPQHHFWLPEGILYRQGDNELLIAQWTRGARPGLGQVHLEAGLVMQWNEEAGHTR